MALSVVEAVSASNKPPAVNDSMRNSTGGRYGFSASAPSSSRSSPIRFLRAGRGSAILPKLAKIVRFSSARAKEVSPYFSPSAAAPSVPCESS